MLLGGVAWALLACDNAGLVGGVQEEIQQGLFIGRYDKRRGMRGIGLQKRFRLRCRLVQRLAVLEGMMPSRALWMISTGTGLMSAMSSVPSYSAGMVQLRGPVVAR